VFSFVASAGGSVGLLAGGVLTQSINWHWIFFVNIPIGIATAVLAMRLLSHDRGEGFGRGADVLGAALVTGALMLLVYTIVKPAAQDGWGATQTLAFGGGPGAARRVRRPRGHRLEPARPAADLPLAQRRRREPDPGADGRRDVPISALLVAASIVVAVGVLHEPGKRAQAEQPTAPAHGARGNAPEPAYSEAA